MIKLLIKKFIKDHENISDTKVREKHGILAGVLGIILNLILFFTKLIIGFIMNSIAIISDAFNNLSDIGSSVVTVIGTKLSNAHADEEHPFGHGRIEYISSLIISFVIIFVGIELLKSSFLKILSPHSISISLIPVLILLVSVGIKIWMYSYNKYIGNKIKSDMIIAASIDSRNDVISSVAIIIVTIIDSIIPFSIDGYVGALVSLFIIYSGYKIAKDTIGTLLGTHPDKELVEKIEKLILQHEYISGIHDLIVHDYGPGRILASVHAEVPVDSDIIKIHDAIDEIEMTIEKELNVHIVIHADPIITSCERTNAIKNYIIDCLNEISQELTIHDFRMTDSESKINVIFDLCVPIKATQKEREQLIEYITKKLKERDKRFNAIIKIDNLY